MREKYTPTMKEILLHLENECNKVDAYKTKAATTLIPSYQVFNVLGAHSKHKYKRENSDLGFNIYPPLYSQSSIFS